MPIFKNKKPVEVVSESVLERMDLRNTRSQLEGYTVVKSSFIAGNGLNEDLFTAVVKLPSKKFVLVFFVYDHKSQKQHLYGPDTELGPYFVKPYKRSEVAYY
jgi:hypothetical protein